MLLIGFRTDEVYYLIRKYLSSSSCSFVSLLHDFCGIVKRCSSEARESDNLARLTSRLLDLVIRCCLTTCRFQSATVLRKIPNTGDEMAQLPASRLASLPGYDTAPDIYETPSTAADAAESVDAKTTSTRSPSPSQDSDTSTQPSNSDVESDTGGTVSRRRISAHRARRRFEGEGRGVQTRGVDLSDRVDGRRKGYGLRYREVGEEEGLEERIARLRREVEECRVLSEREEGSVGNEVEGLGRVLRGLETGDERDRGDDSVDEGRSAAVDGTQTEEQTLRNVANFDSRLSALETALGISALDAAATTDAAASMPLLPSLMVLDQQLASLSSATSIANLEAASARIHKLRHEADTALSTPIAKDASENDSEDVMGSLSPADLEQLRKLYAILPTIQTLSPTVPPLLTRLRSLRTLHSTAASAATSLEDVERKQAEMDDELKAWREGLEKIEGAMQDAQEANGRNGKVVEKWVRELEERMKGLGR